MKSTIQTDQKEVVGTPLQYLRGIGPKRAAVLQAQGLTTLEDLLQYYPRGYLDRSHIVRIVDLAFHIHNRTPVTVIAEVFRTETRRARTTNRMIFFLTVKDVSGYLTCVWFEGWQWYKDAFELGEILALSAIPTFDQYGRPQFVHPQFDRLKRVDEDEPDWGKLFNTGGIIPKYRSNAQLERVGLDSRGFRRVIRFAVAQYVPYVQETLPNELCRRLSLIPRSDALRAIHFPSSLEELEQAKRRLKFEELFFLQLLFAYRRAIVQRELRTVQYKSETLLPRLLIQSLPFTLTSAQKKVLHEIIADLRSPHPMNRLLQGDVGSGKTIVALLVALMAIDSGLQVAFMAPTEILAEQHYKTIRQFLSSLPVSVRLLIGGQRKKEREVLLEELSNGTAHLVVGTHALIEEGVKFHNLGLVIIDEQHRFGVLHRAMLKEKGTSPDVLVMTATPIPRTLAMTLYGDLDVSIIDELPSNRKPIRTAIRTEQDKPRVYAFVKEELHRGRQAYIVFPLIEESEKVDLKAATREFERLQKDVFPEFRVALLHGRMTTSNKDEVMERFKRGEYHILVATTVIEVGIDVPNATIMIIENAERFGLSQLHQLRGRVGRGTEQSYCILIANYEWYDKNRKGKDALELWNEKENARRRLETMVATTDGFKIAEVDLQLRGPGDIFGTRQSGMPALRVANLIEDRELLEIARAEAFQLVQNDPHLRQPEYQNVRSHFEKKYKEFLELGKIA
ncbi:MAG: ATP-dependent DNA helicase RecG [Bacteroidetes bacterium]|nr:ATP-dependent DNA helicase RecG [Bacteroidota bacterium]